MKSNITIILLFLYFSAFGQVYNIPDPNFEQALIDLGLDRTSSIDEIDGVAEVSLAINRTNLDFQNKNISDLTGIENFVSLEFLSVRSNNISQVDLSSNLNLKFLLIDFNDLETLDLSSHSNLLGLYCIGNNIDDLKLPINSSLRELECSGNNLSSLNLSTSNNLVELEAGNNLLTELDLNDCPLLTRVEAPINPISVVRLENASLIENLYLRDCDLTAMDLSNLTSLRLLNLEFNNLHNLDLRNGFQNFWVFNSSYNVLNNPNLTCIEVEDVNFAETVRNNNRFSASTSVTFNTQCIPQNDACAQAIPITLAQDTPGSSESATGSNNSPNCQNSGISIFDVWYQFPAPASGSVTMTINAPPFVGKVALYDDCNASIPLNCAQDQLEVNNLTAGQTYYLQVWLESAGPSRPSTLQTLDQTSDFELRVDDTTTLSQNSLSQESALQLFPNPAKDFVNISSNELIDELQIFDITGNLLYQNQNLTSKDVKITTADWKSGLYLIQATSNNNQITKKLIIK